MRVSAVFSHPYAVYSQNELWIIRFADYTCIILSC